MISPTFWPRHYSASSAWTVYQFTNNLTNLTRRTAGAHLTQLGLTELRCHRLFTLISMVIYWNTSGMTLRFHTHRFAGRSDPLSVTAHRLLPAHQLLVNPLPGASFGLIILQLYRQAMVAAFARTRCTTCCNCQNCRRPTPPCRRSCSVQIICYFVVQGLLGLLGYSPSSSIAARSFFTVSRRALRSVFIPPPL